MTPTLTEKLEALLRYSADGPSFVLYSDLRAIIEQHKQEVDEPVCFANPDDVDMNTYPDLEYDFQVTTKKYGEFTQPLYTSPQPDIVSELVKALEDDAYAASFQSMAGYRTALIAKVKGVVG